MELAKKEIHVCLCVSDPKGTYAQHTGTTIASVFKNTKYAVCIHLIHDETLTNENKENLDALTRRFKQNICYYPLKALSFRDAAQVIRKSKTMTSVGMLYRLKFMDILPPLERMIYLDSDIIVNLDLGLLWNENLENELCGVVRDVKGARMKWSNQFYFHQMKIDVKNYFNSGVILFSLNNLRKKMNLWEQSLLFFNEYGGKIRYCDQDALNALLQDQAKFLPEKFNFIPTSRRYTSGNLYENAIIHFAGPKPWVCHCSPYDWLYWKYFALTPWGDSKEKLLEAQKNLDIDIGYALQVGNIFSRRNLLNAICPKSIAKILGQY